MMKIGKTCAVLIFALGHWPIILAAENGTGGDPASQVPDLPISPPPAGPDEMICQASYLVVATVLPEVAPGSTLDLPLSIKIDQLLAAKNGSRKLPRFQKDQILTITIRAYPVDYDNVKVPQTENQGQLLYPSIMSKSEIIKNLAGNKFIFGLALSYSSPQSQIWSMKEMSWIPDALHREIHPPCPRLFEK
jgi:hypothetical protein